MPMSKSPDQTRRLSPTAIEKHPEQRRSRHFAQIDRGQPADACDGLGGAGARGVVAESSGAVTATSVATAANHAQKVGFANSAPTPTPSASA